MGRSSVWHALKDIDNSRRGVPVTVRIHDASHRRPATRIPKKIPDDAGNALPLHADEHRVARGNALLAFRPLTHDQYRFSQRRRFLLHTARIGQHEGGTVHQPHERLVRKRLDQVNTGVVAQNAKDRLPDVWD